MNLQKLLETVADNWRLKLTAFAIAFLLWMAVQSGKPYRYRMAHVPVRIVNNNPEWIVSAPPAPATVSIEFQGRFRDLVRLPSAEPAVLIPVQSVTDTVAVFRLREAWVDMGSASGDILIGRIRPDSVRVTFDRMATRLITLQAQFSGALADGYELAGLPLIDPPVVRASGPARRLGRLDTLQLENIDLSGLRADDTVRLTIDTTGLGATITPRRVRVVVPVRPQQTLLGQDTVQ
jgi:YbbR domain-containing protein